MADQYKASVLIFDSKMKMVLLIKAPRLCPVFIKLTDGYQPARVVAEQMLHFLSIPLEHQPIWWNFRTEVCKWGEDLSHNYLFFGKLSDAEFAALSGETLVPTSVSATFRSSRVHQQLHYWIPMAIFLSDIPSHMWPRL